MKKRAVIFHNPRCSKSRQTLALLGEHGVEPEIVLYLEKPPTAAQVLELLEKLDVPPHAILRKGEPPYKELGLGPESSARDVARAISSHPILLERPIVVVGKQAAIGRPPENVLKLF